MEPLIQPMTLAEVKKDPLEFIAVIKSPVTVNGAALEPTATTPTNAERPKEGYLMYTEPDDVLDTADDPWKMGHFQIR